MGWAAGQSDRPPVLIWESMNQELHWIRHLETPSYQLHNLAGVKIWLAYSPITRKWILHLGDLNKNILPGTLTSAQAKRRSLVMATGYLQDLIRQITRFNNDALGYSD